MLRLIPAFNNSSVFTAEYNGKQLAVYAVRGRMWATVATDTTFHNQIASFRRMSLPYVFRDAKTIEHPEIECPDFLTLFN